VNVEPIDPLQGKRMGTIPNFEIGRTGGVVAARFESFDTVSVSGLGARPDGTPAVAIFKEQ